MEEVEDRRPQSQDWSEVAPSSFFMFLPPRLVLSHSPLASAFKVARIIGPSCVPGSDYFRLLFIHPVVLLDVNERLTDDHFSSKDFDS
jgi:hypothetical protein